MSQSTVLTIDQVKQILTVLHDSIDEKGDNAALYTLEFAIQLFPSKGITKEESKTAIRKLKEGLASLQEDQLCVHQLKFDAYHESVADIIQLAQRKLTPPEQKVAQGNG